MKEKKKKKKKKEKGKRKDVLASNVDNQLLGGEGKVDLLESIDKLHLILHDQNEVNTLLDVDANNRVPELGVRDLPNLLDRDAPLALFPRGSEVEVISGENDQAGLGDAP